MQHLNIRISGFVQGVFFRYSAKQAAERLRITGFARNDLNGTVYIEAEGDAAQLKKFFTWCKKGPRTAKVEKVTVETSEVRHFQKFDILDT